MIKRYQTKEIAAIFNDEAKIKKWLFVERIVASVEESAGIIPRGLSRNLLKVVVKPERVQAIEKVTNHDVIAFLQAVREKLGEKEGRWLHFGLTSYDLVDTAFVLSIIEALVVLMKDISRLKRILKKAALRYRRTPQMGRTHGVFAQPITFGYKVGSWLEEIKRAENRLKDAKKEISYGKLSGAVGTYTMLSPMIEKKVMKKLGLKPEPISTQVLPRDRFAFLLAVLSLYTSALERIATEIRNLSRSEIGEVMEPFTKGQKGSSAMPHKKNPIICERICGLARVVRGYLIPAYENISLWHERDITNSSVERIIIPDAFHLTHYMTRKMLWVLEKLNVNEERMLQNIKNSYGVYASQRLMNILIEKGMNRTEAYRMVQKLSFQAVTEKQDLRELVQENKDLSRYLDDDDIRKIFDLKWFLRNIIRK
ncbi:MAG TPA: adenylosuccinate lyase [candidate division WOR-3 bacterium]|uniref:Adenylosuccinate lyase n=1 Tax=candidate division WOR-3 bacterium TaxID=2052148 RepID=A0A9C9JZD6_UNCW3|nr:adenylosuccinate lyase [candidate division WOR-3 bacterium]